MKHFLIYTSQFKDVDLKTTKEIQKFLQDRGQKVSLIVKTKDWKKTGTADAEESAIPADVDCMIVLGGDGTVLQAVRESKALHIPTIGVNLGTLGYMTQVEVGQLESVLERLISGDFETEDRMMLNGKVTFSDKKEAQEWALNDIVIARNGALQIIQFNIFVNGHFLNDYSADGVIITTPTGSTGYNLSAGGPIIEPKAEVIMITPICPHTLNQRSIILSPEDEVEIEIAEGRHGQKQTVEVSFDGAHSIALSTGERIRIVKSLDSAKFIKLNQVSFLKVLHQKMSE